MENEIDRGEQQRERHGRVLAARFRESLRDKVKQDIMGYMMVNPQWTPEDLVRTCNMFIRHYALKARYMPPNFKKEEQDGNDAGGTEASPDPAS